MVNQLIKSNLSSINWKFSPLVSAKKNYSKKIEIFFISIFNFISFFSNALFLYYEQNKNEEIAKLLNVKYWATIIIYKNSKEVAKEIGITNKNDIYSLIKKEI